MIRKLVLILYTLFSVSVAIKWLAIHQVSSPWKEPSQCPMNRTDRKQFGLVTYQSRLCRRMPELMHVITKAAKQAVDVCQKTFVDRRWNCSTILFAPNLKSDLVKGTKEQAFVHALSAAAVTHAVAKGCVNGDLPHCPCGFTETKTAPGSISNPDTYKWKGCSDNVLYGRKVSREWADANWRRLSHYRKRRSVLEFDGERLNEDPAPPKTGSKARMNQHNNDVGRRVTQQSQYRKCKCHGVSSGCDVQTCWYTLPSLDVIAQQLKERYNLAYQLGQTYDPTGSKSDGRTTRIPNKNEPELVFLRPSPSYCFEDLENGSFGTKDRECFTNTTDPSSCENLCCQRGYNTKQFVMEEQCHCKYVHCCYVKCRTCRRTIERHYCK